jgi:hypothetical protein
VLTIAARMFSVCKAVLNSRALVSCTDRSVEQVETAHVVEDWGTLVSNADSRIVSNEALFVKIGTHLQNIEQSHDDVGNIVRQLRSIGIKLLDWSSFEVAKWYMKQGYQSILPKSLDKYCCHLRSLLALPPSKLPDKISISAPVPSCYNPGDEIDVLDTKNHLPPKSFLAMCSLFCAHYCRPHVLCLQSGVE